MDDETMGDAELTREQERALCVAEAARARVAAEQAEARVRAALRAMLAVDERITRVSLRWELDDGDVGATLTRRVRVMFGELVAEDDIDALTPQPPWGALAAAEDAALCASRGCAGGDGEEWTEVWS